MGFASNRQLPNEARLFAQVDKSWKDIMRRTIDKPNALRASTAAGKCTTLSRNPCTPDIATYTELVIIKPVHTASLAIVSSYTGVLQATCVVFCQIISA